MLTIWKYPHHMPAHAAIVRAALAKAKGGAQ